MSVAFDKIRPWMELLDTGSGKCSSYLAKQKRREALRARSGF